MKDWMQPIHWPPGKEPVNHQVMKRRLCVSRAVARKRKLIRAAKIVLGSMQYGDAISKLEAQASKRKSKLARELNAILFECGCDRTAAIGNLNMSGWPDSVSAP